MAEADAPRNPGDDVTSQKRLRNRLSQQAFRKRQSTYIKDLERRLELRGRDESEQVVQLEADNRALRAQLSAACSKLERIQIALTSLSTTLMSQLSNEGEKEADIKSSPDKEAENEEPGRVGDAAQMDLGEGQDTAHFASSPGTGKNKASFDSMPFDTDLFEASESYIDTSLATASRRSPPASGGLESALLANCPDLAGLPGIWSYEYQMGPTAFAQACSNASNKSGFTLTNSPYSDHIQMIKTCLTKKWRRTSQLGPGGVNTELWGLSADVMLSLFHSLSRPAALTWYTATRFQENIADLLLWQMHRSRAAYLRMHANYRPSALQLYEAYPAAIDVCPFPTVRDKLILLHSANPYLDHIICDMATAYVVEFEAEKLVFGETGKAYIRVWDLVCAFHPFESDGQDTQPFSALDDCLYLPAPSVDCLFQPDYARQAFKSLGLDDGVPRFKLDPSFFVQYSELYDAGADIIAEGFNIRPKEQGVLPIPTKPGKETMSIYRNVADWCVNAVVRTGVEDISRRAANAGEG